MSRARLVHYPKRSRETTPRILGRHRSMALGVDRIIRIKLTLSHHPGSLGVARKRENAASSSDYTNCTKLSPSLVKCYANQTHTCSMLQVDVRPATLLSYFIQLACIVHAYADILQTRCKAYSGTLQLPLIIHKRQIIQVVPSSTQWHLVVPSSTQ